MEDKVFFVTFNIWRYFNWEVSKDNRGEYNRAGFLDICRYITRKMRLVVGLLTFRCLTWSEFPRETLNTEPFPHLVLIITWYRRPLSLYHFVSLFANIKLSDQSIETLLIIHERNFECFFTHDLTITKSNCVKKIFLHSILILNSRKPLEYVKIDRSHSNASFRKKKETHSARLEPKAFSSIL